MSTEIFPPLECADSTGLLCVGGDLSSELLLNAYKSGIFPWPIEEFPSIPWFSPPNRAVLHTKDLYVSKSLKKELSKNRYEFSVNNNFSAVISACANSPTRKDPGATWISDEMIKAYTELHHNGYAHSVECYKDTKLVGGLYGISIGQMFAGESMFHIDSNASKMCMVKLVELLKEVNISWIDCQVINPFLESLGAIEINRNEFIQLLDSAVKNININVAAQSSLSNRRGALN